MRSTAVAIAVVSCLSFTGMARAQDATPDVTHPSPLPVVDFLAAQTPPPQDPQQKPPAAVGEAGKKPTRGFLKALFYNLGDDLKHMPRKNSLYWLAGGGAVALLVHPEDGKINRRLVTSHAANVYFKPGSILGQGYTVLGGAAATYIFGRVRHEPRVEHLGLDEIEAALLSEGIVEGLKLAVRRDRPEPFASQTTKGSGYSFPSGHSTLTFAAATVLQQHLGYRAAIPTYLIASYVAISRLHDNVHFASDVAFGAGLGILIGRSVTWHGRNFYGWSLTPAPLLLRGGAGVIVVAHAAPSPAPQSSR